MLFWKRKNNHSYSTLKTDLHSHLIPGIDDGVKSIEESLAILKKFKALGYSKVITTPHVMSEYYPNTKQQILSGFQKVKEAAQQAEIDIEIEAAAEYFLDPTFSELLEKNEILTIGKKYILIETSFHSAPLNFSEYLFQIKTKDLTPILAHPERYLYMTDHDYEKALNQGCKFQLNLLSLTGHYGKAVQKRSEKLLNKKWIHFLGTDTHRMQHIESVEQFFYSKNSKKVFKSDSNWLNNQLGYVSMPGQ